MSGYTVHRFWTGPSDIPSEYQEYARDWVSLGATEVITHSEEIFFEMPDHLREVVSDIDRRDGGKNGIERAVQLADIAGYWIVYKYGGIYTNCDIQPLRHFPMPDKPWATYENDLGDVVNAIMGSPEAENSFWGHVLAELPVKYFANPGAEMVLTTGPSLLTAMARRYPESIDILPTHAFNPVHWRDVPLGGDAKGLIDPLNPPEGVYGVHHWGHKKSQRSNIVETATQPKG